MIRQKKFYAILTIILIISFATGSYALARTNTFSELMSGIFNSKEVNEYVSKLDKLKKP